MNETRTILADTEASASGFAVVDSNASEGEIGIVEPRTVTFEEGLRLQNGSVLEPLTVAYETYGRLSASKDNVILLCHALSGGAHAAGKHAPEERKPGWWDLYVGPGKALDTDQFFVVCVNVLASPYGTTSPLSVNPQTNQPYKLNYPAIQVTDWVETQRKVLQALGIERLHAVIGGSTGGMQTLEWAVRYPDKMTHAVMIASAPVASPMVIALNHIQRQAIMMGLEMGETEGERGLALARMLAHISYLSENALWSKFGRETYTKSDEYWGSQYQMESYLEYKAQTFLQRFDLYCYLYITRAMDRFDLAETYGNGSLNDALSRIQARMKLISFTSDWLFPPNAHEQAAEILRAQGKQADHTVIDSIWGHDSFLVERVKPDLKPEIKRFLED
ncbi:MAG: homoserine O-acetyltransferase [Fimbriimonadia bacterium]|nr:homoserine O-acetyltransferase [Fimbriimonadia bacterium]